ncbi:hypothetical protein SO802_005373 [Lithocarpus litseifolius]|uniref:RNase H type-1 domain-containing protein n=1 Tax=Lithocarpus litseifolius TaxID=425828 RepID=A0AAW2DLS2_9ROSI
MKNNFRVTKESDHVVLFTFNNQIDLEQVLNTKPWSFDKHLMVLHRYDKRLMYQRLILIWWLSGYRSKNNDHPKAALKTTGGDQTRGFGARDYQASQARATPSGSTCAPLSVLHDTSNLNIVNAATLKRQVRYTTGTDVIMEDAVGSKRSAHPIGGQPELQKKKKSFLELAKASIGVVIRDSKGQVMVSLAQRIPLPSTVIEVEALAVRRAMELALETGLNKGVLEGDSLILMNALKSNSHSLAQFGHIINDI